MRTGHDRQTWTFMGLDWDGLDDSACLLSPGQTGVPGGTAQTDMAPVLNRTLFHTSLFALSYWMDDIFPTHACLHGFCRQASVLVEF